MEVVIIPPFTALAKASELISESYSLKLGAQNMNAAKSGAYTGEVSASMLRELFVRYVVLGHSERRQIFGETDAIINQKIHAAHEATLKPIFCVGETLAERDSSQVEEVLSRQLRAGLAGLDAKAVQETVIAYEPVWAIGTGRHAHPGPGPERTRFYPARACGHHGRTRRGAGSASSTAAASKLRTQPR